MIRFKTLIQIAVILHGVNGAIACDLERIRSTCSTIGYDIIFTAVTCEIVKAVTRVPVEFICSGTTIDNIHTHSASQRIPAVATINIVVARATCDGIVALSTIKADGDRHAAGVDHIIAQTTENACGQAVTAHSDCVITTQGIHIDNATEIAQIIRAC